MEKMTDENGNEWMVGYGDEPDYIPGYDDGEWDETDDEWEDDFQGEEDFA